jgi:hypothetical protein
MLREAFLSCLAFSIFAPLMVVAADTPASSTQLTAGQIVDKNIAVKGVCKHGRRSGPCPIPAKWTREESKTYNCRL